MPKATRRRRRRRRRGGRIKEGARGRRWSRSLGAPTP